ncbi:phage tail protein I [Serratia sp. NPDC078593]|uniref:phage tail protein I n=1 Tax=unclassified Serratia (in: enterobacteria) TaxID=2647522 RepID=UPI0037D482F6
MSSDRLLPVGSSALEVAAAQACAALAQVRVPVRELWNPQTCPANLLPYLAWAFSVDRWDEAWAEETKRSVVASAHFVHRHKGTISALRRVVEPLGYLIEVREWWQLNETPGTFRLVVGVLETGITEEMYQELERMIFDAKPASRHLTGLAISLSSGGHGYVGAATYSGETLTVYPYLPETLTAGATEYCGAAVHLIDNLRVNA